MTSHDVVLAARRAYGESRIGHAGTLDPFATGLLVLLLGRATRLLPYLDGEPKLYHATIRFGAETNTDDLLGEIVRSAPVPDESSVRGAIPQLTGKISQVPPAFSAKRVDGRRAYDAARAGESLELAPVTVTVHDWKIGDWHGDDLDVRIRCGGGTYIRSLARDLGRLTRSAAHLAALRRIRSGPFDVRDAVDLARMIETVPPLLPPRAAVASMPEQSIDREQLARVIRGQEIDATASGDLGALVNADNGALVAVAERRGARWQPRVVMREP